MISKRCCRKQNDNTLIDHTGFRPVGIFVYGGFVQSLRDRLHQQHGGVAVLGAVADIVDHLLGQDDGRQFGQGGAHQRVQCRNGLVEI